MKIFQASQVRDIDSYTILNEPVESIELMERAATKLAEWYVRHFHTDRTVVIFAGPGNNGGDGLVLARLLGDCQFRVECYFLEFGNISADCEINLKRLLNQNIVQLTKLAEGDPFPSISKNDVVIDGIFGSGLTRNVSGYPGLVIRHINDHATMVIAIDIPSGLFGEDNSDNDYDCVIQAEYTLSFQFPFLSFFFDMNEKFVGKWRILDIKLHPQIISDTPTNFQTIEKEYIRSLLPVRNQFSHKGTFGHALIISGCYGMMGAAILAGKSCLRAGAGLVTMHVPTSGYGIIQTGFPEAIVSLDQSDIVFSEHPDLSPFSAVGIGPGIGCKQNTGLGVKQLLQQVKVPMVIDADGLNILSMNPEWFELLPEGTILTPHPGEFDRMAGGCSNSYERHLKQRQFAEKHNVIVILKGAWSGVAAPDGRYWFNTTGNPGMATGGSGDVLTGIVTGLLAQGIPPLESALAGVYIHGLAGDLAVKQTSQEAAISGDFIGMMGAAFNLITR